MNCYAIDIPEPRAECPRYAEAEEMDYGYFQCVKCGRVERLDDLLPFQRMLGTCDRDQCLESRVQELLAIEARVDGERMKLWQLEREFRDREMGL